MDLPRAGHGAAAATTWIFRGRVAATSRLRRGARTTSRAGSPQDAGARPRRAAAKKATKALTESAPAAFPTNRFEASGTVHCLSQGQIVALFKHVDPEKATKFVRGFLCMSQAGQDAVKTVARGDRAAFFETFDL